MKKVSTDSDPADPLDNSDEWREGNKVHMAEMGFDIDNSPASTAPTR